MIDHRRIRFYSDRSLAPNGCVAFLQPFWGRGAEQPSNPMRGRFDKWIANAADYYEPTNLEDCDFAVLPFNYSAVIERNRPAKDAEAFVAAAGSKGKPCLVFCWHDSEAEIRLPDNAVILRTSLRASQRRPNEHALPSWSEDFVERYWDGEFLCEKPQRPAVGFCGHALPIEEPLLRKGKRALKRVLRRSSRNGNSYPFRELRRDALRQFAKSPGVETKFIVNSNGFWAGTPSETDHQKRLAAREVYVSNMAQTQYQLCARGGGNFSMRLFETLCCGRIPIQINTDTVMPCDRLLDWNEYCIWVEESELRQVGNRVSEFHNALTPDQFQQAQRRSRDLWGNWLSPLGFFKNLPKLVGLGKWQSSEHNSYDPA